jgi:uroporphyrinogen decarboxylase
MDWEAFWPENDECLARAFDNTKPRAAVEVSLDDHWILDEMHVPGTVRYFKDGAYRRDVNRQANDRIEEAIGLRPFSEAPPAPAPLRIEEILGSHQEIIEGGTPWLEPGYRDLESLKQGLDRLQRLTDAELLAQIKANGWNPEPGNGEPQVIGSRGPTTVATSVLGSTEFICLLIDEPELMHRYFDVFADTLIRYQRLIAAEAGYTPRGYYWLDDNCALLSPTLYREFSAEPMRRVFEAFAPEPDDYRYQHSDSEMEHLLPILAEMHFSGVNFGPRLRAETIRKAMPKTMIHGQIAPFTLRNGSQEQIEQEVRRDFEAVGEDGGLVVTTAGSIPAGTTLDSVRIFVSAVDRYCRYG